MHDKKITLSHGSGGKASQRLIEEVFKKHLGNSILNMMEDSAVLPAEKYKIVFTTDSYVVSPVFFPGGDIGKLAVNGTVNDLAAMGANPKYVSISFIIEDGLDISILEKIAVSIKKTAGEAKVKIVAGDTKVVGKGQCDKVFINTSGIGFRSIENKISVHNAKAGDKIIITGAIGNHGIAILNARQNLGFKGKLLSDCAPLNNMIQECLGKGCKIRSMRDATRGGLATVLNEIASASKAGIEIDEENIPVEPFVQSACEILGLDPLYLANEGRMVIVVSPDDAEKCLKTLRKNKYGKKASIIGKVTKGNGVFLKTTIGGRRPLITLEGDQLPRIC